MFSCQAGSDALSAQALQAGGLAGCDRRVPIGGGAASTACRHSGRGRERAVEIGGRDHGGCPAELKAKRGRRLRAAGLAERQAPISWTFVGREQHAAAKAAFRPKGGSACVMNQ